MAKPEQHSRPAVARQPPPPAPEWHGEIISHGVTGTNGKTSTVGLLAAALGTLARPVPSVTTLGAFLDDAPFAGPTTHDGMLAVLAAGLARGARHAVLEMTSEALALGYAKAWPCHGATFTNLSHDHLDAHQSPEHYLASKAQLFMALPPGGYAVLNGCDEACALLAEVLPADVRTLHYGVQSRGAPHTALDLEGVEVTISWHGSSARLRSTSPGVPGELRLRAIGAEHVENALAALGAAILAGALPLEAARAIERAAPQPGRFEVHGSGPHVVIDFAHSPDALARTLRTARQLCRGKLWLVFGAGGNRDREKRPAMGEAARAADRVLLTSDNCRDEHPGAICAAIGAGLQGHPDVAQELDRERAISRAIAAADADDVVLVAGRGPERELQLGSRHIPLVDAEVAEAALRLR
ncbi:MAG TPA: UDP-N-acetylmuramyl-tripeptide synthetase [Polyangiaceae bacterium]|nr:UDP-N-acetylmuramyl-tripeptide synthetase [Polyangiaceae bacterium]